MKKVLSWLLICAMLLSLPLTVIAATDATSTDAPQTATPIPLSFTDGNFKGGSDWRIYSPDGSTKGVTIFQPLSNEGACDAVTISKNLLNSDTGASTQQAVLQYRNDNPSSYRLTYDVKLADSNIGQLWNYFYWTDVTADGRPFETSMKSIGYTLRVTVNQNDVTFGVISYDDKGGYKGAAGKVTGNNSQADFLTGAPAGVELGMNLEWDGTSKVLKVIVTRKDTSAKMEASIDLSAHANINLVTKTSGFAVRDSSVDTSYKPMASIGNFALTDLTQEGATATALPLDYTDGSFFGGKTWKIYSPDGSTKGVNVFQPLSNEGICDAVTISEKILNTETGAATQSAVLQYNHKNPTSYYLSYDVKLAADNIGQLWNHFYWNDITTNGRPYDVSMKSIGYGLRIHFNGESVVFGVIGYDGGGGYKGAAGKVTGTNSKADFLKDAAAGAELGIQLYWDGTTKVLNVVITRKDTSAKMEASIDLSADANIDLVTESSGFAIRDSSVDIGCKPLASIGNFTITDLNAKPVPNIDWNLTVMNSSFVGVSEGDKFVYDDGWFTRSTEKATDVAVITYKKAVTYNHELSFNVKLNAENKGRIGIWNIWDGKFSSDNYGYMLVLLTDASGKLGYRLARYDSKWGDGNYLVTADTKDNLSGSTILDGQAPNAELTVKVKIENYTITVDTCLASDPSKKMGTVKFDLSANAEMKIHRKVDRTKGYAIIDMGPSIDGGAGASAAIGNIVYTSLPGEPLPIEPEVDNNDYDAILKTTYPWSGDIAVTEDNFNFYFHDIATLKPTDGKFTISNGWLTRPAETPSSAYGFAQYKGVMSDTSRDYKLTFSIKCNEDNQCRVSAVTRWEDTDDTSCYDMRKQVGYRFYIYSTAEKLQIFCYQTGGNGYLNPVAATADNANSDMLLNLTEKNVQLDVTMVMKDDLVVIEVHLASDPTKTTGPVAFKLSETPNLFSQIDFTQGFFIAESSNETANDKDKIPAIAPAEIGNIKLYAAAAPENGGNNGGDDTDPDDDIKPPVTKPSTDETTDEKPGGDSTTDPAGDDGKKGCKSSVSISLAMVAGLALGASAIVCRKKKEND